MEERAQRKQETSILSFNKFKPKSTVNKGVVTVTSHNQGKS